MNTLEISDVAGFLESELWQGRFDGSALAAGKRLVASRQVASVAAELLETGDAEIRGGVTEKDGTTHSPSVVLWREGGGLTLEGDCSCDVGTNCGHSASLLFYLGKGNGARIGRAFGEAPLAEKMTGGRVLALEETAAASSDKPAESVAPAFFLRVQHRLEGERSAWLPEVFAVAFAVYAGRRVPLSPAGHLPPLVLPEGKIIRSRADETAALNTLYALDLQPGA